MANSCVSCKKTILMMDTKLSAGGGFYHKECFRCSHCSGQLTTLNFAQLKGVLYCKPHYTQLFKLRGKYDDIPTDPAAGGKAEEASAGAAAPATPSAKPEASPVPEAQEQATAAPAAAEVPASEAAAAAAPAPAASPSSPSAEAGEGEAAGEGEDKSKGESKDKPAASGASQSAAEAAASAAAQAAKAAASALAALEPAKEEAPKAASPAPAPAPAYPDRPVPQRVLQPAAYTAPASSTTAPAAVKAAPAAASASSSSSTGSTPKFGGGGTKCQVCAKTVYGADPQVTDGDKAWHRTCFKCSNCKSNLSLTTWAQIDGVLLDKACYKKLFTARGKYDDVLATIAAKNAAAGAGGEAAAAPAQEQPAAEAAAAPAAEVPAA